MDSVTRRRAGKSVAMQAEAGENIIAGTAEAAALTGELGAVGMESQAKEGEVDHVLTAQIAQDEANPDMQKQKESG